MNFLVNSGSPNGGKDPSFSVMYIDPKTLLPIDSETWMFDLSYANKYDEPKWKRHHDLRSLYNLKDLSPSSFLDVAERLMTDEDLAKKYRDN